MEIHKGFELGAWYDLILRSLGLLGGELLLGRKRSREISKEATASSEK